MKTFRKQLINWLFEISNKIYTRIYKNHEPWNITKTELLNYSKDSLGFKLGEFLNTNNFDNSD